MNTVHNQSFFQRYLDPSDRLDELLFGLIMVLSITLGVGLATDEGGSASLVALTIFGCNLAWGLIDGIMYIVTQLYDRSRKAQLIDASRSNNSDAEQIATVGSVLDDECNEDRACSASAEGARGAIDKLSPQGSAPSAAEAPR
jgi:hypothetical protein